MSGFYSTDFSTTKGGGRRSLASQIRFRKTLEATIPPTLLLDGRAAMPLQPVAEPKQKLEQIRSGPAVPVQPENEVPKLKDARLLAEIQKFKLPRNPATANHLLILEPVLREFARKFSRPKLKELYQRLYARACLVVAALERKYAMKQKALSQRDVFHPAANAARCESMLQVEMRRIRLDVLEVDVLEEMAYEEAERRWRESHPDGEDPPMDADAIVLGTIRNPNAGAISLERAAAERRKTLEKEASQQRWTMQCTVEPAVRVRALGGSMNARFIEERKAKGRRLVGKPLTDDDLRPWRQGGRGRRKREGADPGDAQNQAKDNAGDDTPGDGATDGGDEPDRRTPSRQRGHSAMSRRGSLSSIRSSELEESDDANRLLEVWNKLEVPVVQQYQFLCKFSNPSNANGLQDAIDALEDICELVLVREHILGVMRQLQDGKNKSFDEAIPPESDHLRVLERYGCFISATDLFGVTVFIRLAHIIGKLDDVLSTRIRALDRTQGETLYYRGHKYLNLVMETVPLLKEWLDKPRDWRRLKVPAPVGYLVNPFLRRLGKYVA